MIPLDVDALLAKMEVEASFSGVTSVASVTTPRISSNHAEERHASPVTPSHLPWCNRCNTPPLDTSASIVLTPSPYPGHPMGAPFRPGHQVWLYRWDDQTHRFDIPVTIVQMRTLWPGEQDIGWRDAAGTLSWHNARLAVAVNTQEGLRHPQTAIQE